MKTLWSAVILFFSVLAFNLFVGAQDTLTGGPYLQAPLNDCAEAVGESQEGRSQAAYWHLIYPGTTAFYVGGTVPDMHIHKYSFWSRPWSLTEVRQFHRKGQIALTSDCLLFAFEATSKDSFHLNENFRIRSCSNKINFSDDKPVDATCADVDKYHPTKSYVIMIPYTKVNLLSRAKSVTSDLAAVSTAYATAAGGILTTIYSSISSVSAKERGVGIAAGGLALYYYFFIAKPHLEDNYIGVFVEPAAPWMTLSRKSNRVTVTTALPHYFRVGQQIEISSVANSGLVDISEISRDADGIVTVKTNNEHDLKVGAQLQIADVTDPSFNGQFQVASIPAGSRTTFTYEQKDKLKAATSVGGKVQDVWNGTFIVESINPQSFTYWQPGPNENSTPRTGTAAVVVPVNTNLTVNGNLTLDKTTAVNPKSIDLTGAATVALPPTKSDELFKKGGLLMFRIPNSHNYYNISMTLSAGTGLTFVSETAEKTGK
jgi:hypothetical protein